MDIDRRRGLIIAVGAIVGAIILTILDPSFVWFGVDLPQVFVGLLYSAVIAAVMMAIGYAAQEKYGIKALSTTSGRIGLALAGFAVAFLFDWALAISQSLVTPTAKFLRFAIGAGILTFLVAWWRPKKKPGPPPLAFLDGARRKKIRISTPEGELHQELVVVHRLYQLTLFEIAEEAGRQGWTKDPDGEGRQWFWSVAQHADHFVRVSPGFFVHNGKTQGPMDGGGDVSDPDAWSTVLFTTFEPSPAPAGVPLRG